MYYGTQMGPMWGIERIVVVGFRRRAGRRGLAQVAALLLLASSLVSAPRAAADELPVHLRARGGGIPTSRVGTCVRSHGSNSTFMRD